MKINQIFHQQKIFKRQQLTTIRIEFIFSKFIQTFYIINLGNKGYVIEYNLLNLLSRSDEGKAKMFQPRKWFEIAHG